MEKNIRTRKNKIQGKNTDFAIPILRGNTCESRLGEKPGDKKSAECEQQEKTGFLQVFLFVFRLSIRHH